MEEKLKIGKVGPIINAKTRTESMNIQTIHDRLKRSRIIIPNYQRDSNQWDERKESLFIESIINNLTIPAFFFSTTENISEVVDGQQRIMTIEKFKNNQLRLSNSSDVVYLTPQSIHYAGKTYEELPEEYQNTFDDYPLSIIYLPENLSLTTKLEIFRRINEGGTPLTSQDIRLSYYSTSKRVQYIRRVGIYSDYSAKKYEKHNNPWRKDEKSWEIWKEWWDGKTYAKGQTPSEMFLWYLICKNRHLLNSLLENTKHLNLSFRGSTEEALDIFCAQLKYDEDHSNNAIFGNLDIEKDFIDFANTIKIILSYGLTGISVDKYKQIALFIAAIIENNINLKNISEEAWEKFGKFIRSPRQAGNEWGGYPEPKGRWGGEKGQIGQCNKSIEIVAKIVNHKK